MREAPGGTARAEEGNGSLAETYRAWSRQLASQYPFTLACLRNGMVKIHEHDASWHDTNSQVRRRLES